MIPGDRLTAPFRAVVASVEGAAPLVHAGLAERNPCWPVALHAGLRREAHQPS